LETEKERRKRAFFKARVSVLLAILVFVLLWAWRDVRSRRQRTTWERPLSVALILVRRRAVDEAAVAAFKARVSTLATRLTSERRRYRADAMHPFVFTFLGPVDLGESPPKAVGDGLASAAKHAWEMWRFTRRVDGLTGQDSGAYDSRIYVVARPPASEEREMVEGESEEGGRVGVVDVELDDSMADFALFVATHELFHTLGATDKYDEAGRTLVPAGLAEPSRVPLLPQAYAEVMARNRPVEPGVEVPPESLDELAVGPATAREIGWTR
jgi:hypothetical protein